MDIHIDWEGPFTLEQIKSFNSLQDCGLYQYYGDHPIYGQNSLLYIGMTEKQNFAIRINHNWHKWVSSPVQLYLGRLFSDEDLTDKEWKDRIVLAEKILLFSHSPSFNTANLNSIPPSNQHAHVYNWGIRKSLLPEVSVKRWEGGKTVGHVVPRQFKLCGSKL